MTALKRNLAAERRFKYRTEEATIPGKRVQFDDETWAAIDLLAHDSMRDFQELADEAFRDLLAKHGRPVGLKTQLRRSAEAGEPASAPSVPPARRRRTTTRH